MSQAQAADAFYGTVTVHENHFALLIHPQQGFFLCKIGFDLIGGRHHHALYHQVRAAASAI